ncbi:MAG: TerB family tellurite resistance protein [Christensenellaceae bacterium]|jgi:hypothetical protein|nr:MAG: TerB family tellurite resistance protein [Clostridiales bacterium]
MKDFNELCRSVEELSPLEYAAVLGRTSLKIMPAIRAFSEDGRTCAEVLAAFVIASVYADGKLDESEYLLMAPLLKAFFGEDFDFEDAKKLAKEWRKEGRAVKKEVDYLVDFLGTLSEELKGDIIFACLLMCAVDGKVSLKEKSYIRQLMR